MISPSRSGQLSSCPTRETTRSGRPHSFFVTDFTFLRLLFLILPTPFFFSYKIVFGKSDALRTPFPPPLLFGIPFFYIQVRAQIFFFFTYGRTFSQAIQRANPRDSRNEHRFPSNWIWIEPFFHFFFGVFFFPKTLMTPPADFSIDFSSFVRSFGPARFATAEWCLASPRRVAPSARIKVYR